jgi:hypothetical protein
VFPAWKEADVRSKRAVLAAAAAILALLVVGPASAVADGKGKRTLRVVATDVQEEFVDVGAPGPSMGDTLVFSEVLRVRGREAGMSGGVCTVTEAVPPYTTLTLHCVATLSLRGGQITLQGLIEVETMEDFSSNVVAITGGTGRYIGASGEARVTQRGERVVYKLKFVDSKKQKKRHHH